MNTWFNRREMAMSQGTEGGSLHGMHPPGSAPSSYQYKSQFIGKAAGGPLAPNLGFMMPGQSASLHPMTQRPRQGAPKPLMQLTRKVEAVQTQKNKLLLSILEKNMDRQPDSSKPSSRLKS